MEDHTYGPSWATVEKTYNALLPQLPSQAERDAIGHFYQGLESCTPGAARYDEHGEENCPDVLPDFEHAPSRAYDLPDEFFLHGTSYVVQQPFGWEDLTAADAEAIRTLTTISTE